LRTEEEARVRPHEDAVLHSCFDSFFALVALVPFFLETRSCALIFSFLRQLRLSMHAALCHCI
jgi:hypothetical protein